MRKIIRYASSLPLIASLCACVTGGGTNYHMASAWADKDKLYVLSSKNTTAYLIFLLSPEGGTKLSDSTSYYYQELDKSKLKDGDEIILGRGTETDVVYRDADFSVEWMRPKFASWSPRARITTKGKESTVECPAQRDMPIHQAERFNILPIRLPDRLIYCGYVTPVGGVAEKGAAALWEHRLDYGVFNNGALYFLNRSEYLAHKAGPITLTMIDADTYKVSGAVALPVTAEESSPLFVSGYFRRGYIVESTKDDHVVYACNPAKCRKFQLKKHYDYFSSFLIVEDSGDALIALDRFDPEPGKIVYKVSLIKAEPDY